MDKIFPIAKVVKDRGAAVVVKEAIVPAIAVLFMIVPQSLAYATLAGVPPIYGLYSSTLPLLVYGLFGTSGQVAVGPVAMISLLSSGAINALQDVAPEDIVALTHLLALLSGISSLILGLLQMGGITHLLSHEVLGGFTTAAAIIIASSQMKYVLGVQIGRHHYPVETVLDVLSQVHNSNVAEILISTVSFLVLIALKVWKKKFSAPLARPKKQSVAFKIMAVAARFSALVVVGLASAIAAVMLANGVSVNVVGKQPSGIPTPTMVLSNPAVIARIPELILPAITIALIGFAESYAVGKVYDKGGAMRPNRELVAIGAANIVGAFFNAIPVAGSFGRTAVNANAGSKTTLSNFFTGLGVILVLLVLSPGMEYVPYSALASIIIISVIGLIKLDSFKQAWKVNRSDFAVLATTLVATLALGIELGVAVGTGFSILNIIRESSSPHMPLLGQVEAEDPKMTKRRQWRDIERFPNSYRPPGSLIIRFDSSLFFVNCAVFEDKIMTELSAIKALDNEEEIRSVIVDLSPVNRIDLSGLHMLSDIEDKLRAEDTALVFACAKGAVRDTFQKWSMATARAPFQHYSSIQSAVQHKKVDTEVTAEGKIEMENLLENTGVTCEEATVEIEILSEN